MPAPPPTPTQSLYCRRWKCPDCPGRASGREDQLCLLVLEGSGCLCKARALNFLSLCSHHALRPYLPEVHHSPQGAGLDTFRSSPEAVRRCTAAPASRPKSKSKRRPKTSVVLEGAYKARSVSDSDEGDADEDARLSADSMSPSSSPADEGDADEDALLLGGQSSSPAEEKENYSPVKPKEAKASTKKLIKPGKEQKQKGTGLKGLKKSKKTKRPR